MTIYRHRIIDLQHSCCPAAFAAVLAAALSLALGGAPAVAEPTAKSPNPTVDVPAGTQVDISADQVFDDAGTNPVFTSAWNSGAKFYDSTDIVDGVLRVKAKTAAALSAMSPPPFFPINVTVTVGMANDEGETAEGWVALNTTSDSASVTTPVSAPSSSNSSTVPTFKSGQYGKANPTNAPTGTLVGIDSHNAFNNAGTNPRFTAATFSTTEYYDTSEIANGRVFVKTKSAEDLLALPKPPDNTFTVTAEVTMENDEGQTSSGTLWYRTRWDNRPKDPPPPERVEPLPPPETVEGGTGNDNN